MRKLWIVYDNKSAAAVPSVKEALNTVFGMETDEVPQLDAAVVKGAFNLKRRQCDASKLLNYLIKSTSKSRSNEDSVSLWILR